MELNWHGTFLGFSDEHYFLIENAQNLITGYISLWYHVVFDDLYQKVGGTGEDEVVTDYILNQNFEHNRDFHVKKYFGQDGELIYPPPPPTFLWCLDGQTWILFPKIETGTSTADNLIKGSLKIYG